MKKTINVAIGGCSFIIDDDAYEMLNTYLEHFRNSLESSSSTGDVMNELEGRIADMLKDQLAGREVVSKPIAENVIGKLGYPEGYSEKKEDTYKEAETGDRPVKKLYRDTDDKKIAGVCSGLSLFLGVDVTLIRIIFLVGLICGSAGFWIYIVIWIAAPEAKTAAEKCELRGIPATAENIRRFTEGK